VLPRVKAPPPGFVSLAVSLGAIVCGTAIVWLSRYAADRAYGGGAVIAGLIFAAVAALAGVYYTGRIFGARFVRSARRAELNSDTSVSLAVLLSLAGVIALAAAGADPAALFTAIGALLVLCGVVVLDDLGFTAVFYRVWESSFAESDLGSASVHCVEPFAMPADAAATAQLSLTLDTKQTLKKASEVRPGELFRIASGERVALDGTVVFGSAEVLERRPDAVNVPAFRVIGDSVYAASRVVRGDLVCRAACAADESVESNFAPILGGALAQCRETDSDARSFERFFSAFLLFAAACAAVFWAVQRHQPATGLFAASAVLLMGIFPRAVRLIPLVRVRVLLAANRVGALMCDQEAVDRLNESTSAIIDYRSDAVFEERVTEFRITDDRINEESLVDVLFSLCSYAEDTTAMALRRAIRARAAVLHQIEIANPRWYAGKGVCGTVKGAEFSAGVEGFLIERGVSLLPSEVQTAGPGEKFWYVALDDELIAWFRIAVNLAADAGKSAREFRSSGKTLYIWGQEPPEVVDRAGKDLGLELAQIEGSIPPDRLRQKIADRGSALLLASAHTPREAVEAAHVSCARFDPVRWDLKAAEILLFAPALELMPAVSQICRRAARTCGATLVIASLVSGLLAAPAAAAVISPALVAATVAVVSAAALAAARRVSA
jgi:Cu+-exporting ATPase